MTTGGRKTRLEGKVLAPAVEDLRQAGMTQRCREGRVRGRAKLRGRRWKEGEQRATGGFTRITAISISYIIFVDDPVGKLLV